MSAGWVRTVRAVLLVAAGLILSVFAVAASRAVWRRGEGPVPWGLALATAGSVAGGRLARSWGNLEASSVAGGWLLALLLVVIGRPEGDFAIAGDGWGYAFLLCASVAV